MQRARRDIVFIAALALAANFAYLYFSAGDYFFPDSATYLSPAHNMLRGRGFVTEPGVAEIFRTPGYPLFLLPFLAVTTSVVPILIVQHLLNALLAIAVYLFAMKFGGTRTAAMVAGVVFALDLESVHLANKVLTETLFTAMLFVLWAVALRIRRTGATAVLLASAGALAGMLVLVRPVAILYFVVVAGFLFWTEGRRAAIFLTVALLIALGWGIRNRVEAGVFTVSSVAGTNMLLHRAAPAIAITEGGDFLVDLKQWQAQLLEDARDEIVEKEDVEKFSEVEPARLGQYYGSIGRRIALAHPAGLTLVILRGVLVNLLDSDWEALEVVSDVPSTLVEIVLNAAAPIIVILATFGWLAIRRRDAFAAAFLAATIGYFIVISAGSEAEARFRVPVMPQIAIAAGVGVEAVRRGIREMRNAA